MIRALANVVSGRRSKWIVIGVWIAILVALAITLNIFWAVLSWRTGILLILGVLFFALIIAGMVLNTIFLVREIRRYNREMSSMGGGGPTMGLYPPGQRMEMSEKEEKVGCCSRCVVM